MVARGIARVDNLQRDRRTASRAIIISIKAARRELIAATASTSTIGLARAVEMTLEKLLVDGAIVEARRARKLPINLTGAALISIILGQS